MNDANLIIAEGFQDAWLRAIKYISENRWSVWSLAVQIKNSEKIDISLHDRC